jgi:hypothetical protein
MIDIITPTTIKRINAAILDYACNLLEASKENITIKDFKVIFSISSSDKVNDLALCKIIYTVFIKNKNNGRRPKEFSRSVKIKDLLGDRVSWKNGVLHVEKE